MNQLFKAAFVVLFLSTQTALAQDIPQSQVPSVVVNKFQQSFPKAVDVEWELDGDLYKVEFETGLLRYDHDAWYDRTGKLIRHEEEISRTSLPAKVLVKISQSFSGYRMDDIKKITEDNKVTYVIELKSLLEDWKVAIDSEGTILHKVRD